MKPFVSVGVASRVIFGAGSVAQLPAEVDRLGARKVLVVCTPGREPEVRAIMRQLGSRMVGTFPKALMHVPLEIAEEARKAAAALGADCCVAVGGGSTIGLGKAIALTSGMPVVAVPTTYSGSEMTPILGMTEGGLKKTLRDSRVLPKTTIYDPQLTLGLPPATSAASGMNAIAHCAEALYAVDGNPIVSLMAEEGTRALSSALPEVVENPSNVEIRTLALYGAWLAGVALGSAGMALHHKLCHTLGGTFNLPHAETHSILLPHAVRYNRDAAPEAMERIARALGAKSAPDGLYELELELKLKMKLSEIVMPQDGIEKAALIATESPYPNPRPVTYEGVLALLRDAFASRRPPN
jgi:alcohol dehydrogenase class IV